MILSWYDLCHDSMIAAALLSPWRTCTPQRRCILFGSRSSMIFASGRLHWLSPLPGTFFPGYAHGSRFLPVFTQGLPHRGEPPSCPALPQPCFPWPSSPWLFSPSNDLSALDHYVQEVLQTPLCTGVCPEPGRVPGTKRVLSNTCQNEPDCPRSQS